MIATAAAIIENTGSHVVAKVINADPPETTVKELAVVSD